MEPSIEEKYRHMRDNAESFVQSMRTMVAKYERDGNEDMACNLRVWCLTPWEAAIRDDDSGDLWFVCEVCEKPIKDDAELVADADGDGCWFHRACVEQSGQRALNRR